MPPAMERGQGFSGSVGVCLPMTEAEIKEALADISGIRKAFRLNNMDLAWKFIRSLELRLGKALRKEEPAHLDA